MKTGDRRGDILGTRRIPIEEKKRGVIDVKIVPLIKLQKTQKAKVAYLRTRDQKKLEKIMALGVFPGMTITLIQKFPSCVFQVGQSQFAIDNELAESIVVRSSYASENLE